MYSLHWRCLFSYVQIRCLMVVEHIVYSKMLFSFGSNSLDNGVGSNSLDNGDEVSILVVLRFVLRLCV